MHHALNLPLFGPLADPSALVDIAEAADAAAWDGLFVWDHVLSPLPDNWEIADPWVALGAVATRTVRLRMGTMVTPLTRRRITEVARQTVTLDRLSGGRLTVGVGLGNHDGPEFSKLGEGLPTEERGHRLDRQVDLLEQLWSGEEVTVDEPGARLHEVVMVPCPVQQPRIPLWFGVKGESRAPIRRAARFDGIFPIEVDRDGLARIVDVLRDARGSLEGFDVAYAPGRDDDVGQFEAVGATWAMHSFWPGSRPDQVLRLIARGVPS